MTSQELAKLCGVSKTTVSRVINNDPKVKEETRQVVLEAMKKYNYVPSTSARRLAGIDSRIIGVFIMDINLSGSKTRVSKSSYFSNLTNLIIDKANNHGFQVLVSIITREQQMEEVKNLFMSRTIFSGIVIGGFNQSEEIDSIRKLNFPIIVIDKACEENEVDSHSLFLNIDNFTGAYKATKHLIEQGHKSIGHIAGDMRKFSAIERLKGYKAALKDAGIQYSDELVYEGDFQEVGGYNQVEKLIRNSSVTAIFAANDGMAIGAIKKMMDMGYHVPKDYSIVGFDNIDMGNYITPTLSTVHCQFEEFARISILALEYFIEHKHFEKQEVKVKPELIIRESSVNYSNK